MRTTSKRNSFDRLWYELEIRTPDPNAAEKVWAFFASYEVRTKKSSRKRHGNEKWAELTRQDKEFNAKKLSTDKNNAQQSHIP